MEILSAEKFNEFDLFCKNHPRGAFQQSPCWGNVKTEWQNEIVVSRNENGDIIGGISVLIRKIGFKSLMYACRGPVCDYNDEYVMSDIVKGIKALADKYKAYKFIMDPLVMADDNHMIATIKSYGFDIAEHADFHATIQPRYNYMLNYIKDLSEDELLLKFDRDTRYYIRYPQKKGVECKNLGIDGLKDFYEIYSKTGQRQGFTIRPIEYFEKMLNAFPDNVRLYMCYFEGKPLCGGVAVQYAGTTSHVYGCSNDELRNVRPTYLLQWELMKWALEGGCHTYDMQGVAPRPEDGEALYHVLKFKQNFTGEIIETAGEFTITFDSFYSNAIDFALKVRKMIK